MSKAIFIASDHSAYGDVPGQVYHFPKMYLSRVEKTLGDWVILFAGRRGGGRGYYAVQKIDRIVPDPVLADHYFAIVSPGTLWGFETEVPRLQADKTPFETGLPLVRGNNTSAVRLITDADFARIIAVGLSPADGADALPRTGPLPTQTAILQVPGFSDAQSAFSGPMPADQVRDRILASRAFRDASFARSVKRAYQGRCAISGLALRNGGGRPEVEAAHIKPVEQEGPDIVTNGLALSGTVHWMFDRGLLSVDEDRTLLVAKGSIAQEVGDRLFTPDRKLILPDDPRLQPHPGFLRWHRENVFKG